MLSGPGSRLTHEYLRNHPDDAARVLEQLPASTIGALLAELPARLGAPVLSAMLPQTAGSSLAQLNPALAGALVAQMRAPRAAAALRILDEARTEAIFQHLPGTQAMRIRRHRSFPEDTVGAWVEADVLALTGDQAVEQARRQVRARHGKDLYQLYVIDHRRHLQGTVALAALLHADDRRTLASLVQPVAHRLSTGMSLAAARRHRGWASLYALPVLEPGGAFVGELRLGSLHHLDPHARGDDAAIGWHGLEALLQGYCATAAGVIRLLLGCWEPSSRDSDRGS